MKKILTILLSLSLFYTGIMKIFADYDYYLQEVVVSAYYSPLPNQSFYMRGSYNADMKLN